MRFIAKHRHADVTPRKLRPFAALIRGKTADEAMEALRFLPNRGARLIEAVLKSAVGNAEDRGVRNIEDLMVIESRIDGGPIMKRFMPRARGMATPIKKRYAHIIIAVDDGRPEAGE
jgi:large subunit ribosomal protein L22